LDGCQYIQRSNHWLGDYFRRIKTKGEINML
jgi:hypothetical protein